MKLFILILMIPTLYAIETTTAWIRGKTFTRYALLNSLNNTEQAGQLFGCLSRFPQQDINTGNQPMCEDILELFKCLNNSFYTKPYGSIIASNMTLVFSKDQAISCPTTIFPPNFTKSEEKEQEVEPAPHCASNTGTSILLHVLQYLLTAFTTHLIHLYHRRIQTVPRRESPDHGIPMVPLNG